MSQAVLREPPSTSLSSIHKPEGSKLPEKDVKVQIKYDFDKEKGARPKKMDSKAASSVLPSSRIDMEANSGSN